MNYYFKKGTTVYKVKPNWDATLKVCEQAFNQPELELFVDEDTMGDVVKEMSSVIRSWSMFNKESDEHSIAFTSGNVTKLVGMEKYKEKYLAQKAEAEKRRSLFDDIIQCNTGKGLIEFSASEDAYQMRLKDYEVIPRKTLIYHGTIEALTEDVVSPIIDKKNGNYADYVTGQFTKKTAMSSIEDLLTAAINQQAKDYKYILLLENDK